MKTQAKPQESKIKIIPYDHVNDLRCSNQITYLRNKLHESAQILDKGEFYIQMQKAFVNSVLFFLLGQLSYLEKDEEKNYQKETTEKQIALIKSLFEKISARPKQTDFRQGAFIEHIHNNSNNIIVYQMVVEMGIKVWNKIGPKKLSPKYKKVCFNLQNYEKPSKPAKNNKNMLISSFDQTEESIVLCFFEAKTAFSKNSIDDFMIQALKQQTKEQIKIQEKEQPKVEEKELPKRSKQDKKQENLHSRNSKPKDAKDEPKPPKDQKDQQPKMQKVGKKKQQQQSSLFQTLSLIFLAALIFLAWHEHEYQREFTQADIDEKSYKINEFELKIVLIFKESRQFLSPYKESVAQWSSEYVSPWVDPITGTFSEIVNHEMVTNATLIVSRRQNKFLAKFLFKMKQLNSQVNNSCEKGPAI